jgi:hypothetical protein
MALDTLIYLTLTQVARRTTRPLATAANRKPLLGPSALFSGNMNAEFATLSARPP